MNKPLKVQLVTLFSACVSASLLTAAPVYAGPGQDLLSDDTATTSSAAVATITSSDLEEEAMLLKALESSNGGSKKAKRKAVATTETPASDLGLVPVTTEASIASANAALAERSVVEKASLREPLVDHSDELIAHPQVKTLSNDLEATDAKLSEMELSIAKQMEALKSQATTTDAGPSTASVSFEEKINDVNSALLSELMASESPAAATEPVIEVATSPVKPEAPAKGEVKAQLKGSKSSDAIGSSLMKGIENLERENRKLASQLADARRRASNHEDKLKSAQARLLMAETEVDRLTRLLESRGISVRAVAPKNTQPELALRSASRSQPVGELAPREAQPVMALSRGDSIRSDMPIATVTVDKANLRAGPSLKDGVLMSVSRGSRLVVERRIGDWLQVVTPANTRAYVAGDMVIFGNNNPESAVRIRASKERDYSSSGYATEGDSFKFAGR